MPRFAANLSLMFNEVPFPDRFAAAARAGFQGVEFLFPYAWPAAEVARWLHDNGLVNVLFNLPPGDWDAGERGIAGLPGREAEFREGVERALVYAEALGTPRLHVMAGLQPPGVPREECLATYAANLRHAADRLARTGLTLLIEPINPRDIPGYLLNRQDEAHRIREAVGAPNLQVQMDLYHAQIVEGDLTKTFLKFKDHVGHVQIASVPARHEPDQGEVAFEHLFAVLDEAGYTGWVGCEYRPRGRTEDGLGWLQGRHRLA